MHGKTSSLLGLEIPMINHEYLDWKKNEWRVGDQYITPPNITLRYTLDVEMNGSRKKEGLAHK